MKWLGTRLATGSGPFLLISPSPNFQGIGPYVKIPLAIQAEYLNLPATLPLPVELAPLPPQRPIFHSSHKLRTATAQVLAKSYNYLILFIKFKCRVICPTRDSAF